MAIFDLETITLTGYAPSQAAQDRLEVLAVANSKTPTAVINNVLINEDVPSNVGVRVIEMNSVRSPEETAQILPEHALELDRVVTLMKALPKVSVLIVGHADQRGDDIGNFEISDLRARAVVDHLRLSGIAATRLSSRASGESDLLTLDDDSAALALNRRTEFVFYGLLAA